MSRISLGRYIPLDIIAAIVAAPIDAITERTDELGDETALINAQIALLEAQSNLVAAQQAAKTQEN